MSEELEAEVQFKADLSYKLFSSMEIQWKNIASSKDKLSNFLLEMLTILEDGYTMHCKNNTNYPIFFDLTFRPTMSDLWMLIVDKSQNAMLRSTSRAIILKITLLKEFEVIIESISKRCVYDTRKKMEILVYYVFNIFSSDYRISPVNDSSIDVSKNFPEFWLDFVSTMQDNKTPILDFEHGI